MEGPREVKKSGHEVGELQNGYSQSQATLRCFVTQSIHSAYASLISAAPSSDLDASHDEVVSKRVACRSGVPRQRDNYGEVGRERKKEVRTVRE